MTPRSLLLGLAAVSAFGCSNSVPYGPDSAMVPLAEPVQGCRAYRLVVDGGYAPAIVYFRRPDGGFTKNRREAACPAPARAVGE